MTSSEESPTKNNHLNDMIIIWLDETQKNPEQLLLSQRKTLLLSYIKSIQTFTSCSECENYINKMKDLSIFLVVSGSLGEKIVPQIHHLPQMTFIYIFCADQHKHELWAKSFNKIRGVFIDDILLSTELKNDVCSLSNLNFPFGLFDSAQRTLQDLTQEQASFMWFQLIVEVLLRLPQTSEAKTEMISECRTEYEQNQIQLNKIALFETIYQANDAIRWYTDNSFVFQLFNRAFRKQDFETIFKYRYFLVDLFNQLSTLYNQQYKKRDGSLKVYRGQLMCQEELMKLKQNIGHLISINTFLSTSTSCAVAADFSGNGEHESIGIVSVIFEITIDLTVSCQPFANIDQLSCIKDEHEILFSIGTIFQIESVDQTIDTIWLVKLSWTDETNKKLKETKQLFGLLDFYRKQHIGNHPSILTFGLFLSNMGFYRQALHFYIYLRKILPKDHADLGVLYNNLGEVLRKLNYFNYARYYFELALEFGADTLSFWHPMWAIIYNNIGVLDINCNRPKQALKCYRCALLIVTKLYVGDDSGLIYTQELLASIYHGMGCAYIQLYQFQRACQLHEKALKIELQILPSDHPTLIESYYVLGEANMALKKYAKAVQNHEEAMRIAQKNLLTNDSRFVPLHREAAILAYYMHGNTSKAEVHCSHTLHLLEQSTFSLTNSNQLHVYEILEHIYTDMGLIDTAIQMWKKSIEADKNRQNANSEPVDFSDLLMQMNTSEISNRNSHEDPKYITIGDGKHSIISPLAHSEAVTRCEIADKWRAKGYLKEAITYYTWLLERLPTSDKPEYSRVHKSRLHNNLGASYQDLNDDQMALHHYQLALDTFASNEEHKSMQAAIIHYNIALIHKNYDRFDEAQMHLHKSLAHFMESPQNQTSILHVQIYIAFAEIYEQCNEWHKARDYYQRIVDQIREDAPDHPTIARYEKRLQYCIDALAKKE